MILENEAATETLGSKLARAIRPGDVITLSGPLGVGKTALARALIRALGHQGEVPSPSFAIVQPYEELEPPVWHVDLYRIEDFSELGELGPRRSKRVRKLNTASNQAVLHLRDISQLSPPALEVMRLPSLSMTIVPEWSVRMVRAPARPSDARTSALGWP